jgi:hypothetical protein
MQKMQPDAKVNKCYTISLVVSRTMEPDAKTKWERIGEYLHQVFLENL